MSYANDAAGIAVDTQFESIWNDAYYALRQVNRECAQNEFDGGPRLWWVKLAADFQLHPMIRRLVSMGHRPRDWQLMLLEWPHISVDDEEQIAYTRNEAAGLDYLDNRSKRQTRTPIGKYLTRHYPHVPDHIRRDWMLLFSPAKYEIWDTREGIISGIELGPTSCMKSASGGIPFDRNDNGLLVSWNNAGRKQDVKNLVPWHKHPYAVYAPELGWRMAVRLDAGKPDMVMGRALLNGKTYVRSYKRNEASPDGYSYADEKLEAWLGANGYSKERDWEGRQTLALDHPHGGLMMPYLDGDVQTASYVYNDKKFLTIESDGDFQCTNTDGTVDNDRETIGDCDRCGETVYEDDEYRIWAGPNEDVLVCSGCSDCYTYVRGMSAYGRGYREYYVRDRDAVEVAGESYDSDNLPDFIVCCEDGEYRKKADCVKIDDEWYDRDSDDIVLCEDSEYRLIDDCWESAQGNWYSNDDPQISVEEGNYHADELQDLIDNA